MSDELREVEPDATETENETRAFEATVEDAGARLDAFLAARISDWSRSRLQRLIEDGDVLVGGRAIKPSYKLRAGDLVEAELAIAPLSNFTPEDIPIEIVYEDDELVIVNKPAGMVVHPAAGAETGTLANALAFHFARLSERAGAIRPGIVHRLDKDTSGLLVVAKTEDAHEKLADQFRAREVFKSYVALVHGRVAPDAGRIAETIGRDPQHRARMAVVRGGRHALSLYRVRRSFERFTLLDVEIKTGRTHQIRVHLSFIKHPVVGDKIYGGGRDQTIADPRTRARLRTLGRQFLHAAALGFRHPRTGEALRFAAPLPPELSTFLEFLD